MFAEKKSIVLSRLSVYRALTGVVAFALALVAVTATVSAKQYKTIAPKMDLKASRVLKGQVSGAMRNQAAFAAGGKESIDRYFKTYYFPKMTQETPGSLAGLGKKREDLVKLLRGATVPAAQKHLTELTMGVMRTLSRDNYHPAVRYNAALILGMLDQKYASGGANPAPPVVLPAGTNELLELLEKNEFNGVQVHPSVKVGALEGLERHARFGLDAQYTDRVTKAALAVLAQEPTDTEVDADVSHWIQCQAASVLAVQFKDGPNAEVHAALTKLIANDKMSLEDRCCVVGLLKNMKYAGAADADIVSTLLPLGILTQAVVAEGAEKAEEYVELRRGNAPAGRRASSFRRRGEEGPKFERRELLSRLFSITKGAGSLSKGLPEAEKQKIQSLTDLLKPVIIKSLDKKTGDLDVTGEVIKLDRAISTIVANWQPAKPAADAVEEDFAE